jgi:uncharacterized protein (DUF433 family)
MDDVFYGQCSGRRTCYQGTRLAVEFILDLRAEGWSQAEILQNYPRLTHEDIQACLSYASPTKKSEDLSD